MTVTSLKEEELLVGAEPQARSDPRGVLGGRGKAPDRPGRRRAGSDLRRIARETGG